MTSNFPTNELSRLREIIPSPVRSYREPLVVPTLGWSERHRSSSHSLQQRSATSAHRANRRRPEDITMASRTTAPVGSMTEPRMLALSAWACARGDKLGIMEKRAASTALKVGAKRVIRHPQLKPQAYTCRLNFDVNYSSVSTFQHAALGTKHCFSGWPKMY
jgi:hypothetical protein